MGKYPVSQSAISRAWADTKSSFHSIRFFFGVEIMAAGLGAIIGTILIPDNAQRIVSALYPVVGAFLGVLGGFVSIFIVNLVLAPLRQRNEARLRLQTLEKERIPRITVQPDSGRRQWDYEHQHLMWVELRVTNTSLTQTLSDVEVQVRTLIDVMPKQDDPTKYILFSVSPFAPTGICWSERFAAPNQLKLVIPPNSTRVSLLAFCDNSNGMWAIFNTPILPKPNHLGGAQIEVEVSSPDSAPFLGKFYIECHPNYLRGERAHFEFVEWDTWLTNHDVAP